MPEMAACDIFADVVSASLLSSYGRQQQWATQLQAPWATVVDDHTFLRPPPAPSCTAQGFCTPQPVALRPALGRAGPSQAKQTVAVLLVARPAHRRLRPAGGRPPPALIVVRPCTWPMGHDGLSPSCRAKSIVAVMTLWQTVILSPKQRIRACLRETVLSPTSCRLWAVWAGPDVPTTLGLHPPATKPIQGGNFWIGRRKGAGVVVP